MSICILPLPLRYRIAYYTTLLYSSSKEIHHELDAPVSWIAALGQVARTRETDNVMRNVNAFGMISGYFLSICSVSSKSLVADTLTLLGHCSGCWFDCWVCTRLVSCSCLLVAWEANVPIGKGSANASISSWPTAQHLRLLGCLCSHFCCSAIPFYCCSAMLLIICAHWIDQIEMYSEACCVCTWVWAIGQSQTGAICLTCWWSGLQMIENFKEERFIWFLCHLKI